MTVTIEIPPCVEGKRTVELDTLSMDGFQKLVGVYMGPEMEAYFAAHRESIKQFLTATAHDIRRMMKNVDPDYMEAMAIHCEIKQESES